MSFTNIRKIPSPEEIIAMTPLEDHLKKIKAERDEEIKNIFAGKVISLLSLLGLAQLMMKILCVIM